MAKAWKDRSRRRFTLIELLVVIVIIAIIASLLLPALARVKYRARTIVCVNHLKQVGLATVGYCGDYDGFYPIASDCITPKDGYSSCNRCGNNGMTYVRGANSVYSRSVRTGFGQAVHQDRYTITLDYYADAFDKMMLCPHVEYDTGLQKAPAYATNSKNGGYQLWWRNVESSYIDKAMVKLGRRWRQSSWRYTRDPYKGKWFNVIASDKVAAGKIRGMYYGNSEYEYGGDVAVWKSAHRPWGSRVVPKYDSDSPKGHGHGGSNDITQVVSYRASVRAPGNFLTDDGAVLSTELSTYGSDVAGMNAVFMIPGEFAE